eukprot:358837-Chlamydomonas_euryale.AAC.5
MVTRCAAWAPAAWWAVRLHAVLNGRITAWWTAWAGAVPHVCQHTAHSSATAACAWTARRRLCSLNARNMARMRMLPPSLTCIVHKCANGAGDANEGTASVPPPPPALPQPHLYPAAVPNLSDTPQLCDGADVFAEQHLGHHYVKVNNKTIQIR